ncbi:TIR domain-containing protein [Verrucomicrobium sp. BvORR106]|uniref:TIR domain-containing protein n=1 Tax=Verrucomicrobium sp. BvORR106 TaxID=1403819 RepID=UPI0005714247|nr:TIR domain-containing protein [Verrucomicrobium sp. BvORR106]
MNPTLPLLVHIVFHPKSSGSLELARHLHRELNGNPLVPGLRIPTMFSPFGENGRPLPLRYGQALRNFVLVLADDCMNLDSAWCSHVADLWEQSQQAGCRFVPVQLSGGAWPLDDRLRKVNFLRAFLSDADLELDEATRKLKELKVTAAVVRRVVVELCRFLAALTQGAGNHSSKAPVRLFLSHTKLDMEKEPKVTKQFIACLTEEQPIEAWVDSGNIDTGSEFAKEIAEGVAESSGLLAILTDLYATREWCREEVLLAKENHRPVVVVDALSGCEVRSFPYLGNVPRIRWDGDPQKGIDLLLKESLRHLHTGEVLKRASLATDTVFCRAPELATMVGLPNGASVLYPDPPVGEGEKRRLGKAKVPFQTPLQRLAKVRLPQGTKVALSMSESTDIAECGMDLLQLGDCMVDISRYLLIKGATLAYGGHLGAEGYTQRLFELVRTHQSLDDAPPPERVVNYLGWPIPRPSPKVRSDLKAVATIEALPRPTDVDETLDPEFVPEPAFFAAEKSPRHRFAWARGMTEMRAYQADKARSGVVARIVLGGVFGPTEKVSPDGQRTLRWYAGRIPGVLEEVVLSLQAGQPVFLIGAFGGAAKLAIDLIRGIDRPEASWHYQKKAPFAEEMRELYQERHVPWLDYPEIAALLREKAPTLVNPGLSPGERDDLFETVDPHRMVELILKGLEKAL